MGMGKACGKGGRHVGWRKAYGNGIGMWEGKQACRKGEGMWENALMRSGHNFNLKLHSVWYTVASYESILQIALTHSHIALPSSVFPNLWPGIKVYSLYSHHILSF